jgi:hypothetical protein
MPDHTMQNDNFIKQLENAFTMLLLPLLCVMALEKGTTIPCDPSLVQGHF